jgi:NADPH:quinone reductase-like Zn-dependent oxidoreductase
MVGGEYVQRNIDAMALEGRLVQISTLGGARAEINMAMVMQRRLTMTGSTLRVRSVAEKGAIAKSLRDHVWPLLESGAVRPVVYATFPLRDAAEAHRMMESSRHIGKLVLVV